MEAAWKCVTALRPELTPLDKRKLAVVLLRVCDEFNSDGTSTPTPRITAAQITSMVWTNSQCIQKSCPMLLFADRLAAELNEFFQQKD